MSEVAKPIGLAATAANAEWMRRHQSAIAACGQRPADVRHGPVFKRGSGVHLYDAQGELYYDLTCGYSANNFGHAYPPLLEALQRSALNLGHLTGDPHIGKILLAEQLGERCGFSGGKVLFNSGGSRAIETAWKAAFSYRPGRVVSLAPAFHGRSLATSWLSDTRRAAINLPPEAFEVRPLGEYPYCARCPVQTHVLPRFPECGLACSQTLFSEIQRSSEQLSAIIVEPAIGARGYLFPPAEFFQRLREVTQQLGILLIADEIQTGIGRCGAWLLSQRQGWQPDVIVLGKSLGGGLIPISAVVGRAEVLDAIPNGAESETFSAGPLACGVAMAVLDQLADGQMYRRADQIGQAFRDWFESHPSRSAVGIKRVEGIGGCCVLEFADDPLWQTRPVADGISAPAAQAARRLAETLFEHRLLIHHTGPQLTRLVFLPPLNLDEEAIRSILKQADAALQQALPRSQGSCLGTHCP